MKIKNQNRRNFLRIAAALSSGIGLTGCSDDKSEQHKTIQSLNPNGVFDVCIVGTGPAGVILASELGKSDVKILLVEGGSRSISNPASARNGYPIEHTRFQGLGGTSNLWDGTCPRYLPSDFNGSNSTIIDGNYWPVTYEELMPFYFRAEKELRVYGTNNAHTSPRDRMYPVAPPVDFEQTALHRVFEKAGLDVVIEPKSGDNGIRVTETHIPNIVNSPKTKLIKDHKVIKINCSERGEITGLVAITPNNEEVLLTARKYVLACGGIETPRLLLLSSSKRWPNGIGNDYDNVGRYFQEHLWLPLSRARIDVPEHYNSQPEIEGLIWEYTEQLKQEGLGHSYFECALKPPRNPENKNRGSRVKINAMLGLEPQKSNRVVLDESRLDPWGQPSAFVELALSPRDLATLDRLSEISLEIQKKIGAQKIKTRNSQGSLSWTRWTHHHMGTCRMGVNKRTAVVNENLKVHGTTNLYVSGSACFVTPGANGPTLLLTALTLRLADHLKQI